MLPGLFSERKKKSFFPRKFKVKLEILKYPENWNY